MNQKKKKVSLVWAISRRNVVNGKYLHSTTKARGIDSLCFRSPSAPPLHSLTRGEATDHRFPTPLAFSTMPLVHDDDDDEPVARGRGGETAKSRRKGEAQGCGTRLGFRRRRRRRRGGCCERGGQRRRERHGYGRRNRNRPEHKRPEESGETSKGGVFGGEEGQGKGGQIGGQGHFRRRERRVGRVGGWWW